MSQEDAAPADKTPATEPTPKDNVTTTPVPTDEPPKTFDAEYVKQLRSEAASRRTENQQLQKRLDELEERDKSELEKAQTKATKLEQAKADAESKLLRFEVATEKAVPKELVPRLRGSTREELEADADELLNLVKSRNNNDNPDFDGGAREPAPSSQTPEDQHQADVLKLLGLAQT